MGIQRSRGLIEQHNLRFLQNGTCDSDLDLVESVKAVLMVKVWDQHTRCFSPPESLKPRSPTAVL